MFNAYLGMRNTRIYVYNLCVEDHRVRGHIFFADKQKGAKGAGIRPVYESSLLNVLRTLECDSKLWIKHTMRWSSRQHRRLLYTATLW